MNLRRILLQMTVLGVSMLWVFPYVWMTLTSVRTLPEIMKSPAALPSRIDLGAYREVFATIPVSATLFRTVVQAGAIALLQIVVGLPAAYALQKLHFRGREAVFAVTLACLLVSSQVTFVPTFLLFGKLHLVNTFWALVLPFGTSAFGVFLFRQALTYVPNEIIEAARMDGASEAFIIYRILGPMLLPTLTAFFIFSFLTHYSDYFWPLVMTTDSTWRTLPLAVALFREQGTGVRWHLVMAANVVLSLPILVLFALLQKHLLRAVTKHPAA